MGTTIVMVTHDPQLARRARRIVHIIDGQLSDIHRQAANVPLDAGLGNQAG
jgi:putative ABC transport system ATP-binding protein